MLTSFPSASIAGIDALIWQSFASILLPGLIINQIVKIIEKLVSGVDDKQVTLKGADPLKGKTITSTVAAAAGNFNKVEFKSSTGTVKSTSLSSSHKIPPSSVSVSPTLKKSNERRLMSPSGSFTSLFKRKLFSQKNFRTYLPTVVGLLSIPFIIHPIDTFTDYALDRSIRMTPFWTSHRS